MKLIVFIFLLIGNISAYCKPLIVGVLEFAPPFSSLSGDGNNYYGFSIDLMDELCKRIKQQCVYKPVLLTNQLSMLDNESVNILFTPTPISSINSPDYIFSLPFLPSDGHFLTLKENKINTLSDMKNKKVGVLKNSLFRALIEENSKSYSEVKEYDLISDLIAGLGNKEIDVIIVNDTIAHYILNNNIIVNSQLIGEKIPAGDGFGMLALKKNESLIKDINSALLNMEADGTYLTNYIKYFGGKIR